METQKPQIALLIPEGHEQAIGRRMLIMKCQAAGIIDSNKKDRERELRSLIHNAKMAGVVICNAGDGFFLPTPEDIEWLRQDIKRHESMAKQILIPLHQSRSLLEDFEKGRIK